MNFNDIMGEMGNSFNFKMTLYHKKTKEEGGRPIYAANFRMDDRRQHHCRAGVFWICIVRITDTSHTQIDASHHILTLGV